MYDCMYFCLHVHVCLCMSLCLWVSVLCFSMYLYVFWIVDDCANIFVSVSIFMVIFIYKWVFLHCLFWYFVSCFLWICMNIFILCDYFFYADNLCNFIFWVCMCVFSPNFFWLKCLFWDYISYVSMSLFVFILVLLHVCWFPYLMLWMNMFLFEHACMSLWLSV